MNLVLQWMLGSSGTAVLIIILRYFLQKNIKATWVYTLWLVLLVRLLCPYLPSSPLSILNPIQNQIQNQIVTTKEKELIQTYNIMSEETFVSNDTLESKISQGTSKDLNNNKEKERNLAENLATTKSSSTLNVSNYYNPLQIKQVLIFIWGVGSLVMFFYYLVGAYLLYKKGAKLEEIKESNVIALYERCRFKIKFSHPIKLYWADSPMSYGVIQKYIVLPKGHTEEALENMIMHELMHHKRRDLFINVLIAISLVIHWFNPIIWLALYLMKQDAELACDERVIEILKSKQEYAMTLLKLSDRQQVTSVMGSYMGIGKKQLKRRIIAMGKMKKRGVIVGSLMVICVVVVALICLTSIKLGSKEVNVEHGNALVNEEMKSGTIWEHINKIQFENPVQHVELSPGGKNAYVFDDEPSLISSQNKDKLYIVSESGQISKDIFGVVKEILEKELNMENAARYHILEQSYEWDKEIFKMTTMATGGDGWKDWTAKRSVISLVIDPKNMEDMDIQVTTETVGKEFKLSTKEQQGYDDYMKTKNIQILKDFSPIEIMQILQACIRDGKYEQAYELMIRSESKESYLFSMSDPGGQFRNKEQDVVRLNSLSGLLSEGKVIETEYGDGAIIEYEMVQNDRLRAIKVHMTEQEGVWKMVRYEF